MIGLLRFVWAIGAVLTAYDMGATLGTWGPKFNATEERRALYRDYPKTATSIAAIGMIVTAFMWPIAWSWILVMSRRIQNQEKKK